MWPRLCVLVFLSLVCVTRAYSNKSRFHITNRVLDKARRVVIRAHYTADAAFYEAQMQAIASLFTISSAQLGPKETVILYTLAKTIEDERGIAAMYTLRDVADKINKRDRKGYKQALIEAWETEGHLHPFLFTGVVVEDMAPGVFWDEAQTTSDDEQRIDARNHEPLGQRMKPAPWQKYVTTSPC